MWQTHVSSAALKLVSPATRTDRNATRRDKSHTLRMRQPESRRRQKRLDVLHIDRCPKEAVVTLLFVFLPKQLTCGQPQYSVTRRKKSRTVIRDQEMSRFSAMMIFLTSTASVLLVLVPTSRVDAEAGAGWEYKGPLGPDQWYTEYPDCAGRVQSPINIDTAKVLYDPALQYFDFKQYKKCNNCTMELENVAGHTAEVIFHGQPIIIKGGSLPDEYVLDQFHFHWGENASFGSEHKVDMKSAPLEMHIVHHMKRFAANESATHPYGLAVLGFFFEIVPEHNDKFDVLLEHFEKISHKGNKTEIEPFALLDLIPEDTKTYYRYYGSLTTPPCYETVIWTLFTNKIKIDESQLGVFRTLKTVAVGGAEVNITNDFRPLQELHERNVISNDRKALQSVAYMLAEEIREDIKELQQDCGNIDPSKSNAAPAPPASTSCVIIRCLTSLVALGLLLGWKAVGRV